MTYLTFLLAFVLFPLGALLVQGLRSGWHNASPIISWVLVAVAAPAAIWWDHAAARWGIWQWNNAATLPPRWWGLPIEEIGFIIALMLLIVQWYTWLRAELSLSPGVRILTTVAGFGVLAAAVWYGAVAAHTLATETVEHPTYLVHLMAWGMPIVALQWLVGGRHLWRSRHVLIGGGLGVVGWFGFADALALRMGLWSFTRADLIGQYVGNVPIEEILFFGTVTLLVAQTVVILQAWQGQGLPRLHAGDAMQRLLDLGTYALQHVRSQLRTQP